MQPQTANLIGLSIGFAIGGAALAVVLLTTDNPTPEPVQTNPPAALASASPRIEPAAPAQVFRPVEMPQIATPSPTQPDTLPNVIYPDPPADPGTHKPGTGVSGTGFFVASDGGWPC